MTTDELTEQVTGGEFADEMLAGLDEIGLTGLALFPDALRHFFAFGDADSSHHPMSRVETIRALRSAATYALIEALGAKGDDPNDYYDRVVSGEIVAAESSYVGAGTSLPTSEHGHREPDTVPQGQLPGRQQCGPRRVERRTPGGASGCCDRYPGLVDLADGTGRRLAAAFCDARRFGRAGRCRRGRRLRGSGTTGVRRARAGRDDEGLDRADP